MTFPNIVFVVAEVVALAVNTGPSAAEALEQAASTARLDAMITPFFGGSLASAAGSFPSAFGDRGFAVRGRSW